MNINLKKKASFVLALVLVLGMLVGVLCACNPNKDKDQQKPDVNPVNTQKLTLAMPDGTPALAAAKFLGNEKPVIDASSIRYEIEASIVAPSAIAGQMAAGQADLIIAPTNLGASQIKQGADYKLVSVAVEGSLYVMGRPVEGKDGLTLDDLKSKKIASIGQNNTPDKVFRYIIDNTDGISYEDFEVQFVADGAAAIAALNAAVDACDYAIVGEPAATVLASKGFSARLDLQAEYKRVTNSESNFPQACLFVKTSLANDREFVSALLEELSVSVDWVKANAQSIGEYMKDHGSASAFPAGSIPRCAICATSAEDPQVQTAVRAYLSLMVPNVNWLEVKLFVAD